MNDRRTTTKDTESERRDVATVPPGGAIDYGADAGAGGEDMARDEFKIPLLRILQTNSPQVDGAGAIEGARPGMILNTSTGEFWDVAKRPLVFVPCYRDHNYVEYIPRDPWGGGFVGIRSPSDELVMRLRKAQGKFGKLTHAEGTTLPSTGQHVPTEIVETYYLFGLLFTPDDQMQQDVVPFVSTQIGKYQNLMTRYNSIRYPDASGARILPPLFAHRYLLSTEPQQNKKGKFYGWRIRLEAEPPINSRLRLDDPIYEAARAFNDLCRGGAAKIDREAEQAAGPEAVPDEEVPF